MPAKSDKQALFMRMVQLMKQHQLAPGKASPKLRAAAKSMTTAQAKDFSRR